MGLFLEISSVNIVCRKKVRLQNVHTHTHTVIMMLYFQNTNNS